MKYFSKNDIVEVLKNDDSIRSVIESIVEEYISELYKEKSNEILIDSKNHKTLKELYKNDKKNRNVTQPLQNAQEMQTDSSGEEITCLIEEKKLLKLRIGELQGENATLKDNNSGLQERIDKLENEIQIIIRDKEKLESDKNSLTNDYQEEKEKVSSLQNAKAKLEELLSCRFDKAWGLYNRYQEVNDYYKRLLVPVFPKDEFESFVGGMFQEKNLERLWDIVKEAQEDNSVEQETLEFFWNIFTYSLFLVNKTKKEPLYSILSTKMGEKFDTYKHTLTIDSKAQGNLKEVFLPGFQNLYTKKIIRKSIVTI